LGGGPATAQQHRALPPPDRGAGLLGQRQPAAAPGGPAAGGTDPLRPTPQALAALDAAPEDFTDLAGLVDVAEQVGWTPVYAHISDAAEWDSYEWSWVGSLTEWALDNPGHPGAAEARATAREHREQWLRGYRNELGFATLVLRRA
jgi:hypothetical protein